jgi:hypothetical protein
MNKYSRLLQFHSRHVITFPYVLIVFFIYSAITEKQWVYAGLQPMPDYYSAIKPLFSTLH